MDHEKKALEDLNAELLPSGLAIQRKLSRSELRVIGLVLVALGKRLGQPPKVEFKGLEFPLGDWLNYVEDWYGAGEGPAWLDEAIAVEWYRERLIALSGVTLMQLQHFEQLVKVCCACLGVKVKSERFTYKDFLSPDPRKRGLTLGWFRNALKNRKDAAGNQIFAPTFEERLDRLVTNRNFFIHKFWAELFSGSSWTFAPSIDALHSAYNLLGDLFVEAHDMMAPFLGLFYVIGKSRAEMEGVRMMEDSVLFEFSKYEGDFLAARGVTRSKGAANSKGTI